MVPGELAELRRWADANGKRVGRLVLELLDAYESELRKAKVREGCVESLMLTIRDLARGTPVAPEPAPQPPQEPYYDRDH